MKLATVCFGVFQVCKCCKKLVSLWIEPRSLDVQCSACALDTQGGQCVRFEPRSFCSNALPLSYEVPSLKNEVCTNIYPKNHEAYRDQIEGWIDECLHHEEIEDRLQEFDNDDSDNTKGAKYSRRLRGEYVDGDEIKRNIKEEEEEEDVKPMIQSVPPPLPAPAANLAPAPALAPASAPAANPAAATDDISLPANIPLATSLISPLDESQKTSIAGTEAAATTPLKNDSPPRKRAISNNTSQPTYPDRRMPAPFTLVQTKSKARGKSKEQEAEVKSNTSYSISHFGTEYSSPPSEFSPLAWKLVLIGSFPSCT